MMDGRRALPQVQILPLALLIHRIPPITQTYFELRLLLDKLWDVINHGS
jgi:hypothetical protein